MKKTSKFKNAINKAVKVSNKITILVYFILSILLAVASFYLLPLTIDIIATGGIVAVVSAIFLAPICIILYPAGVVLNIYCLSYGIAQKKWFVIIPQILILIFNIITVVKLIV